MVNPHFFFEGKLSREESASAFFATLLEQSVQFRSRFLGIANLDLSGEQLSEVVVERDNVDISLHFTDTTIIVEIKVSSGSKIDGQLRRYYDRCVDENASRRVVCIYLAPTSTLGQSEIEKLDLRDSDAAISLSWQQIAELISDLDDISPQFASHGIESVLKLTKRRSSSLYERSGDREFLYDAIDAAFQQIQLREYVCHSCVWKDLQGVEIFTTKTGIMATTGIEFEANENGEVSLPRCDGKPYVTLFLKFVLSKKYGASDNARSWWSNAILQDYHVGSATLAYRDNSMIHTETISGTAVQITDRIVSLYDALIKSLGEQIHAVN